MEGVVLWFDGLSGEGMIGGIDGNSYYCHWSAIKGKFPAKNGKKRWAELESGWKVKFDLCGNQVDKLKIVSKDKAPDRPSLFSDRDLMKQKLAAAKASFDEIFPVDPVSWDEYYKLSRTTRKLTKKQVEKLAEIEEMRSNYRKSLKAWNADKTIVINSIYREHSNFGLLHERAASS